jgi:hypothetical protein
MFLVSFISSSPIFSVKTVHYDCTDESDGVCCIFHVLLLRHVSCDMLCFFVVDYFDFCCEPDCCIFLNMW